MKAYIRRTKSGRGFRVNIEGKTLFCSLKSIAELASNPQRHYVTLRERAQEVMKAQEEGLAELKAEKLESSPE